MATFNGTVKNRIDGLYEGTGDIVTPSQQIATAYDMVLANGVGANQANAFFADTRSLAGSGNETLDLFGGLTDFEGTTLNFIVIRELFIKSNSTSAGETFTLSSSFMELDVLSGTSPTAILGPSGIFHVQSPIDGFTVTNTSADSLTITNDAAGTVTYDIIIIGTK